MPIQTGTLIPLESGDRLTRAEFHRRYCARPEIAKAELIAGVVYVTRSVPFSTHGRQHGMMVGWLGTYAAYRPGVNLVDGATVVIGGEQRGL
jgi:hypothetical protein